MAGVARQRLGWLLAAVVLLHGVMLEVLARQHGAASALQSMATPLFTRMLQPEAPPALPVSVPKTAVARTEPRPVATKSIAQTAIEPTQTAVATSLPPPSDNVAASNSASLLAPESKFAIGPAPPPPLALTATASVSASGGTGTATMDSWPADTRLGYVVTGQFRSGPLFGNANVQWQRQTDRYQTRVEINVPPFLNVVLTSQGTVTLQELLPQAYEELRNGKPRGAKLDDRFVTLANGSSVARPPGVQDTASQFVELSHRFATGQNRLEVGQSVTFSLARPGGIDVWTYDITEREQLKTAKLGTVEAFHLKPRPLANPRGDLYADMWFAPRLQYLPVRIRLTFREGFVDMLVDQIEQR